MQNLKERGPFHFFLMVLAIFLSMTTVVLASIPVFILRASAGRKLYVVYSIVLISVLAAIQGPSFMAPLAAILLMVGIFEEARSLHCSLFQSGLASLLVVTGCICLVLSAMAQFYDFDIIAFTNTKIEGLLSSVKEIQPSIMVESETILRQIPSAIVMIFMLSLWLGLLGSSYITRRFKSIPVYLNAAEKKLFIDFKGADFEAPSVLIWPAIVFMGLAFIDIQQEALQIIASNFLNVLVVVYFFQGIALIAYLFKAMEIGPFWQWLWYVILVLHMFLLVSSIGFADFWVNFKDKINKHFMKAGEGRLK